MIKVGDKYQERVVFTQEMVNSFIAIIGDNNPIHTNTEIAREQGFSAPIVHGMLAGSMFGRVLGVTFPGLNTINLERSFTFVRPVYVDEQYTMSFKVTEVDVVNHTAIIKCCLKDQHGKACVMCITKIKNEDQFKSTLI